MLTDVFMNRYEGTAIWSSFEERERRLMVQAYRLIIEQVYPIKSVSSENTSSLTALAKCKQQLCVELGTQSLAFVLAGRTDSELREFFNETPSSAHSIDRFIKTRVSFIELVFRLRDEEYADQSTRLPSALSAAREQDEKLKGSPRDSFRLAVMGLGPGMTLEGKLANDHDEVGKSIRSNIDELNARFQQAGFPLLYHAGFIQMSTNDIVTETVEKPFWSILSVPKWKNAEQEMLEAMDRRDNRRRDAALSAAKALESVIMIISAEKGWTTVTLPR